jgi:3-oxoacyl-(acyl-carrier-protein) synthase
MISQPREQRVAVTGLGVASPIGTGVSEFCEGLRAGRVGTRELTRLDTSTYPTHRGGEVLPFTPSRQFDMLAAARESRSTQLAMAATDMALADTRATATTFDPKRVGVCFGVVLGNRPQIETNLSAYARNSGPLYPPGYNAQVTSRAPALAFGLRGPNRTITTACAAGNSAISFSASMIRSGRADAMIAGGADELSEAMFALFSNFQSLAPDVVRPFDKGRRGLMLSEGAGALLLEAEAHARSRRAHIYGFVLGDGNFTDAHHMTAPHPQGLGAVRAMAEALRRSDLSAAAIDYISAHGTGTVVNDLVESRAIREVFGELGTEVPVSSIKSMLGHAQGAASAIAAVACLLAIRHDFLPPNVNYREPDSACGLNIIGNAARSQRVRFALNNAFGFGGNISCVVFGKE